MTKKIRHGFVFTGFVSVCVLLFLFSYTQVDLNLTLSRVSIWQGIQKWFQYIGFYHRPVSGGLYIGIVVSMFTVYGLLLGSIRRDGIGSAFVWRLIYAVTGILLLSYPAAFSYDFFNYLFTAKTVLVYHQNPYSVTPLEFSGIDPWTNFMRWTHLSSAYTPLWIFLSLFPYIFGLGYFVTVLFFMKGMIAGFYLLSCWVLEKILDRKDPSRSVFGLALFALNPLIIIESLVSGHNDIVLVAFALLAVLAFVRNDTYRGYLYLSLSIAAKFMTLFLVPVFVLRRNTVWMLYAMLGGLILVVARREMLPWYWVWILPFIAINCDRGKAVRSAIIVSVGLLMSYAPYVFYGEFSPAEQVWKASCIWVGVGIGMIALLLPASGPASVRRIS